MSKSNVIAMKKGWHLQDRPASEALKIQRPRKVRARYFSVKDIAARFGVGISVVYDLIYDKKLDAEWLGGWRVSEESIGEYLAREHQRRLGRR